MIEDFFIILLIKIIGAMVWYTIDVLTSIIETVSMILTVISMTTVGTVLCYVIPALLLVAMTALLSNKLLEWFQDGWKWLQSLFKKPSPNREADVVELPAPQYSHSLDSSAYTLLDPNQLPSYEDAVLPEPPSYDECMRIKLSNDSPPSYHKVLASDNEALSAQRKERGCQRTHSREQCIIN